MYNYIETLGYIHSFSAYATPPHTNLEKIKYLCDIFENPQDSLKTIHVAGTNGKGSTVAMLADVLQRLGLKTGRFISPYIEDFSERISVGNIDISKADVIYFADKIKKTMEKTKIPKEFMPNEFDFVTLMAFLYYREKNCDIAVIETGLGGRLDPTNAIASPQASVITSIGLDHVQYLGDTIEKIATEKCGIIKQNSPVIISAQNAESVLDIAKKAALAKNCEFISPSIKSLKITKENFAGSTFEYKSESYRLGLAGRHQIYNALTVIETIKHLFGKSPDTQNALFHGLENAFFPARFETLSKNPLVILDGAHNMSGVEALIESIKNLLPGKKIVLVCGMLKDKNPEDIIPHIAKQGFVEKFIGVPVNSPRAESPQKLCEIAQRYCKNSEFGLSLDEVLGSIFARLPDDKNIAFVCFGSLYLAGEVKKIAKNRKNERHL